MTTDAPTRRHLVAGGAAALGSVALVQVVGAETAEAATSYRPNPYPRTSVPTWRQRHYLNRLGCGFSRGTFTPLRRDGDARRWVVRALLRLGAGDHLAVPVAASGRAPPR